MTAGDIQLDHDIEVVDSNYVLAHLSPEGRIEHGPHHYARARVSGSRD